MTYKDALTIAGAQERNLKKINNVRFAHDGYEYRIKYVGGFAAYVAIDRRREGKRRYEYFGGVGAYNCWTVGDVMNLVMREVEKSA